MKSRILTAAAAVAGILVLAMLAGRRAYDPGAESTVTDLPRLDSLAIREIVAPVAEQVEAEAFPGAAIAFGARGSAAHTLGLGRIGWREDAAPVDPDSTIYDLASLTKVLAAASAIMLLVDEGRMWLDDPMWIYLPDFAEGPKADVTVRHVLTHTSGLPAGAILRGDDREDRLARAATFPIFPPPGAREEYSDVGFVLLWEAAERAAGEPLTGYLDRELFGPLRMTSTGFLPGLDCDACAPTGRLQDQSLYRGRPFDPLAQRLDGVSGNAGLFSTAADIGRFARMILNGGELDGVRVLSETAAREFIAQQPFGNGYRLGWEVYCEPATEEGGCARPVALGHNGWTGTSLWLDPESETWLVLLTNRTYEPRAPNRIQEVRRAMFARLKEAAASL